MALAFACKAFQAFRASPRRLKEGMLFAVVSSLSTLSLLSFGLFWYPLFRIYRVIESLGAVEQVIFWVVLYAVLYRVLRSPAASPARATGAKNVEAGGQGEATTGTTGTDGETKNRAEGGQGKAAFDAMRTMEKTAHYIVMTILKEFSACFITAFLTVSLMWPPFPTALVAVIGILSGMILGWRHAKRNYLPKNAVSRYLPVLAPVVVLLAANVFYNYRTQNLFYLDLILMFIFAAFPCGSFSVFFAVSDATRGDRERTPSGKKFLAPLLAVVAILASMLAAQSAAYHRNTFTNVDEGPTVADYIDLERYHPAVEYNSLARLDETASLRISDDFPRVDGATAFFPMYSAILNETYDLPDKAEFKNYLFCSRTPEAYSRLIRGEVDVIFVLQPSDEQIEFARASRVEMRFTPIAKEAFVFFVNMFNPVKNLSIEQIQDIYTKKIINWRDVGGDDVKILPFQRSEDSGSQTAMLKEVMEGKSLPPPLKDEYYAGMGGMVRGVADYRDYAESIGYSFRFFTKNMVKLDFNAPPWAFDEKRIYKPSHGLVVELLSIDGMAPTEENIRDGTYPFTVEIYAATAGTKNPRVRELIDWILSPQGQKLIEKTGYVGIR
jgi:phosphate transport system substrate-binding protein